MGRITKSALLLLIMAISAFALTACGSEEEEIIGTLTFGTSAKFPPFEFVTDEGIIGQYDGIDIAIAKQLAEENNMAAVIENIEFESLLNALQDGQVDAVISGMTVSEKRQNEADFSIPYYTATQVMIVEEASDISKAADISGMKICVVNGYTGEKCIYDMGYPYKALERGADAVTELINGNCDVVVIDSATAKKYVQNNPGLKIVEDPDAFEAEEYAIAVKKGNTELLNMINTFIETRLEDGTIAELCIEYMDADAAE